MLDLIYYKIVGLITNIDIIIITLLFIGSILLVSTFNKLGKRLIIICASIFFVTITSPLPFWLANYLEDYFPRFISPQKDVKGIIILGGSYDLKTSAERGKTVFNMAAGRLLQALEVCQTNSHLSVIFTGGGVRPQGMQSEAELTKIIMENLNIPLTNVIFEDKSMSTQDNATMTYDIVKPQKEDRWMLVTSALHMPRPVNLFRQAGWNVIPYPVDYHTNGKYKLFFNTDVATGLMLWKASVREIFGMINNWMYRKTDTVWPIKK